MTAQPIPLKVRQQVWERSGYVCEACGLDEATHIHHRKKRSQGGTHDLVNLIHVSYRCHDRIHANLGGSSYDRGLLVYRAGIPAMVPVVMYEAS